MPGSDQISRDLDADFDRALGLVPAHRRPGGHVGRPWPDLSGQQPGGGREAGGDADVDDADLRSNLRGKGIDDRAGGEEVRHHLGGDLLRPRRDALSMHAVIAGEDGDHRGLGNRRRALARQPGQPDGEILKRAERAARLGQPLLPLARG